MKYDIEGMKKEQKRIAKKVVIEDRLPRKIKTIGGFDIGYSRTKAKVVGVVLDYESLEIIEKKVIEMNVGLPYIPTFLTFREGPPLIKVYERLRKKPDVIMFNGQGISHPLRVGLASHVGVMIRKPSIGVAQNRLVGEYKEPSKERVFERLMFEGEQVGWALRSKEGCRPLFVSPGHRVSLQRSLGICLHCLKGRKLPEPLAIADGLSK